MRNIMVQAFILISVTACCTPGVKPEDANIFQAACGISSGEYERQSLALQIEAGASADSVSREQAANDSLMKISSDKQAQIRHLQAQLNMLNEENRQLQAEIDAMEASTQQQVTLKQKQQAQLDQVNSDLRILEARLAKGQADSLEQQEMERLQQEVATLRRVLISQ